MLLEFLPAVAETQKTVQSNLITIESDKQSADNSTGIITASGNVRLVYIDQGVMATSHQAQYFTKEGRIVLSGDVDFVYKNGNLLRANRITYSLIDERALATPSNDEQVFSQWSFDSNSANSIPDFL
ncbi:hypothetical protein CREGCYN_11350 [Synechococcus sp. M16CYN]